MSNISTKFDLSKEAELKSSLIKDGFEVKAVQNAIWRAQGNGTTITLYKTGKILVQGKNLDAVAQKYLNIVCAQENPVEMENDENFHSWECWIGTDESGKGDYFGPLVVSAVLVNKNNLPELSKLNVQDSKKIKDSTIEKLAVKIKEICKFSVVTINPEKYNELYPKFNNNLNNLLAWGHARAIENILERESCENVLSDKFGNEALIKKALLTKGKNINLVQRVRAESDIAVAAASILARNEFVKRIKSLSDEYKIELNKGASDKVEHQAQMFLNKYGSSELHKIAKMHFKTTNKLNMKTYS